MIVVQIIARFNIGGTATWLSNLSRSLELKGIQSTLVTGNCQQGERENEHLAELDFFRVKNMGRRVNLFSDLFAFLEIRKMILSIKPDIVNTHTSKAGVLGRLAVLSLGKKRPALVHTVHGHLLRGYFPFWKIKLIIGIERVLAFFTDLVLYAGENVRVEMIQAGVGILEKSRVVFPGVDITDFANSHSTEKRNESQLIVGWLGRMSRVKRPDRVLELAKAFPNVTFLLGGDGELMSGLKFSAPKNCQFLGWVDPRNFWPSVDISLLTSDNEAFAISIIEAALNGVPTVATKVGSVEETIVNEVTGILCDTEIDSLRLGLERLIQSKKLRISMGKEAASFVKSKFSLESQCNLHIAIYKEAISMREKKR